MRLETCFRDNFTQEYTVNLHSGSFFLPVCKQTSQDIDISSQYGQDDKKCIS